MRSAIVFFLCLTSLMATANPYAAKRQAGFTVYWNLTQPRVAGFGSWCKVPLDENHSNRQPTQPPSEWSNFTFEMPYYNTDAVQLTAMNEKGEIGNNTGAEGARIINVGSFILENILQVSLTWWWKPWVLYIGFEGSSAKADPRQVDLPFCKKPG